jgi:hypothetical protein
MAIPRSGDDQSEMIRCHLGESKPIPPGREQQRLKTKNILLFSLYFVVASVYYYVSAQTGPVVARTCRGSQKGKTMVEVQILIPTEDNDKVTFETAHHVAWEKRLTKLFPKGWSLVPGTVAGVWSQDGREYRDTLRVYVIGVPGLIANGEAILKAARFAKRHYRQEAIYVRYLNVSETI